jgi:hypothetical protein
VGDNQRSVPVMRGSKAGRDLTESSLEASSRAARTSFGEGHRCGTNPKCVAIVEAASSAERFVTSRLSVSDVRGSSGVNAP